MPYKVIKLGDGISVIQEIGVASFMRCNIWHVAGRDYDLIVDTGMGLDSLKQFVIGQTDKPLVAVVTHCHFDHSGCLHEFDRRLGHPAEADILASPTNQSVVYDGAWTRIAVVDTDLHPDYSASSYHIKPAPLTGYVDEGDVIDLGDRVFQVLHLPGHSPGSIGLWDVGAKTLFSGDALYDGELLDSLYHSDRQLYLQTLLRIETLGAETFHAGHYPSFGAAGMRRIIADYREGNNKLGDVEEWFRSQPGSHFDAQDWSGFQSGLTT